MLTTISPMWAQPTAPPSPATAKPATAKPATVAPAPAPAAGLPAIPADCTPSPDAARTVTACTAYLRAIGRTGARDNDRMATVLASRATGYTGQGLHKAALGDITRALYHLPNSAPLWHQRGLIRSALGQNIRAAADQSIALRHDPRLGAAYVARSESYRRLGAWPKAIADADAALKLDAGSAPAYLARGLALEKTDKAKADADVKKALELDPQLKTAPGLADILKRFGA